jgi:hypothetical protein
MVEEPFSVLHTSLNAMPSESFVTKLFSTLHNNADFFIKNGSASCWSCIE